MGVLDQITQLKRQGYSDNEIIGSLQEQGISPREINNAMGQSEIKNAVSDISGESQYSGEMMPSMMAGGEEGENTGESEGGFYQPSTQEVSSPQQQQPVYPAQGLYSPQTQEIGGYEGNNEGGEYYQPDQYSPSYSSGVDSDSIIEISEQVFLEKSEAIRNQVNQLNEFKTIAQVKIENIADRLKKMESIIDNLQISILERVGSYGNSLDNVKKEMSMMQDSFGKVINPLTHRHATHSSSSEEKPKRHSKRK